MAVKENVYRVVKRAAKIRIERGEDPYEVIASYPKLSEEQSARLTQELIEEGVIPTTTAQKEDNL